MSLRIHCQRIIAASLLFVLIGCANKTSVTNDPKACAAFVNESNQTDQQLMAAWVRAQTDIASQSGVCLNALDVAISGAPCQNVADRRALNLWPCNLTVISVADGGNGWIPCSAGKCIGYSTKNTIWVAASGAGPADITYEMENIILQELGYVIRR